MSLRPFLLAALPLILFACDSTIQPPPDTELPPPPPDPPVPALVVSAPVPAFDPVPTAKQLEWQRMEMTAMIHYGPSTYNRTGHGWESWPVVPDSINPSAWNPRQWTQVARETGIRGIIMVAKHHNGFHLWPTETSDFDIALAPFEGGTGDMVGDVAEAAQADSLAFGVYLSPWDMHAPDFETDAYRQRYHDQVRELMTAYGPVFEIWFDAARGDGIDLDHIRLSDAARLAYSIQPDVMAGPLGPPPDFRWGGNEEGIGEESNWMRRPGYWQAPECNFPMRRNWFWAPSDDDRVMTAEDLVATYFTTQGRSCQFLIGLSPDHTGRLTASDVQTLRDFRARLDAIFADDLAAFRPTVASDVRDSRAMWAGRQATDPRDGTFWATSEGTTQATLEIELDGEQTFTVVEIREPIEYGQRIGSHRVEVWDGAAWQTVVSATTVGYRRLHRIERATTTKVRLVIDEVLAPPVVSQFSLYDAEGLTPDA